MRSGNSRKIAILGSGIVSNIATKILNDVIILTKRRAELFLNNIFFHDTIENRLMLILLGIEFTSKDVPVDYYDNNKKIYSKVATDEIRLQIAKEKMGDTKSPIILSTMTKEKPEFRNLFFNENKLKSKLIHQTEAIELFPTAIVEGKFGVRLYFDKEFIEYADFEYIINTIPQPFFAPLVNEFSDPRVYKYNPLVFVTHNTTEGESMTYSYNNCFWKRIFIKNNIECIEFNKEDWDEAKFNKEFPWVKDYQVTEIPYGRISSVEVPDTKRIINIGRFAQWQHSITTEHVINKLINLNL